MALIFFLVFLYIVHANEEYPLSRDTTKENHNQFPCVYHHELSGPVIRATVWRVAGYSHRAIGELRTVLSRDSTCGELWYLLALAYRDAGQLDSSIWCARYALALDTNLVYAYELLSEILALRNPVEAARYALSAMNRAPTLENRLRAAYLLRSFDTTHAIELLHTIVKQIPMYDITADLIRLCTEYRDTAQALSLLKDLLFNYPDKAEIPRSIGLMYALQGEWDSAWKYIRLAIYHMDPLEVRSTISQWLELLGQNVPTAVLVTTATFFRTRNDLPTSHLVTLAQKLFMHTVLEPAMSLIQMVFERRELTRNEAAVAIDALGQLGNAEQADALLRSRDSVWHDSWIPLLRFYLARHYNLHPPDIQLHFINDAFRRDSSDPVVLLYAAHYADSLGNRTHAIEIYRRLILYDPVNPVVLNNLAYLLAETNQQLGYALELASQALELDSANASILDTYGWILFKMGRYEEALPYFERAVSTALHPSATLFEHLGDNYNKLGVVARARYWWKRALEIDPARIHLNERLR